MILRRTDLFAWLMSRLEDVLQRLLRNFYKVFYHSAKGLVDVPLLTQSFRCSQSTLHASSRYRAVCEEEQKRSPTGGHRSCVCPMMEKQMLVMQEQIRWIAMEIFVGPATNGKNSSSNVVWRKRTCSQASHSGMTFFSVTLRKKKRAMWTSKCGLKSGPRFGGREKKKQFGGPQNGVQILHPILRSHCLCFS